ncbi:MAG: ABC transporter permease, partial [Coriobacteriia bacterium]|nr:ABC transporter permease [Coriobacteriia bacterium]
LLQLIMFGYVVGSDVRNIPTAIVDQDRTVVSRQIAESFTSSGYFVVVSHPENEEGIRSAMDRGEVQVAVLLPTGLSKGLERGRQVPVEIVVDGSDSKTASVASGYAAQIIASFNRQRLERLGLVQDAPGIDTRVRVLYNPALRAVNAMVPGLAAFIMLLSVTAVMSQAVVKERERGTLEQMFVTPITRGEYLVGKVMPYVIISTVQVVLVMLFGSWWFNVPFNGSVLLVGLGLFLFLLTGLGMGLFFSTVSRTRQQAQQATMFMLIPTMVLSGFIFPIESMPAPIVPLTYLIPLRYVLVVLRSNWMKGSGFDALWPQFAAMTVIALLVFGGSLWRFQKRLGD